METVQSVDTSLRRLLLSSTLVLSSVSLFAQTVSVKGTVTDPAGEPIIGATVLEKGTTNGTMTDAKGHFVLKAKNPKATIRVSYVGYKPLEMAVVRSRSSSPKRRLHSMRSSSSAMARWVRRS